MYAEGAGVRLQPARQAHLGEDLVITPPGRPQAPEQRPVTQPALGELLVQPVQLDRGRALRRPDIGVESLRGLAAGGEDADRVPYPRLVVGGLRRPGVDAQVTSAGLFRAHPHLHCHGVGFAQDERRRQGELLDQVAADLVTGPDRQLQERGAGEQHPPAHDVIGEPGLRPQRQLAGQQNAVRSGQRHSGAQQRMPCRGQPQVSSVAHALGAGPVQLVLERVGGQVDAAAVREHRLPVDRHPVHVQFCQRHHGRCRLVAVLAQYRDEHGIRIERVAGHGGQDAVRAQFQIRPYALGVQRADAVGEPDRASDLVHPVIRRAQLLVRGQFAGHVRDHGNFRRTVGQRPGQGAEVRQHRVHQRRMERMRDPQPPCPDPPFFQNGRDAKDRALNPGDHHGVRTVHRRDRHLARTLRQQRGDLLLRGLDRDHRPTRGQRLHQPRPARHQRTRVAQRQHPGHVSGGELPDRMTGQHIRHHTPGLHQPEQGRLQREQRRLRPPRPIQQLRLGEHDVAQRPVEQRVQLRDHRVQSLGEHREALIQLAAHARPLAALAREQHRQLWLRPGHRAHHTRTRQVLG
ncbi:hypothetical protein Aple_058590 [Acrocarpospora pleiomorpha]|uniref:Uncharacterized protein n=1 Tax=Acrocarpospora pleiomorpha TaxID=90975 RepID=A0A5M3XQ51_9ACTN|nr:hypothetical protein Aple_058590 [Acrocarpospora pleiomorpha]